MSSCYNNHQALPEPTPGRALSIWRIDETHYRQECSIVNGYSDLVSRIVSAVHLCYPRRTMERVEIEKMVFGGQGMGHLSDGRVVFVWNALPGEEVDVEITKKKHGYREGIARVIHVVSPDRVDPKEPGSYLSTSPWQMMTFEAEQRYKVETAKEAFKKLGDLDLPELSIVGDAEGMYGYRNKMEFSFYTKTKDDPIELCFYARGSHQKVPVQGSALAEPVINSVAARVVEWLNAEGVNRLDLKTLIIRSNGKGEAIAALFVKQPITVSAYPALTDGLKGFQVYASNPKSPASVPTELLYAEGPDHLTATINGVELKFGLLSFFQVNQPLFGASLEAIEAFLGEGTPVVDMYSGVGSIGLPLAKHRAVTLVESNAEANVYARDNVAANSLDDVEVVEAPAEQVVNHIASDKLLVLDPPRAGVHQNVIDRILEVLPTKIAYLSCNISTQARDVSLLQDAYHVVDANLYNFFPRTPHTESLILLERR